MIQGSEKTFLIKDQLYYIEADMLEGGGDDHLSVGVKLPNGKSMLPIPQSMLRLRGYFLVISLDFVIRASVIV